MRTSLLALAIVAVYAGPGCPVPAPAPFIPCGTVTATLNGRVGIQNFVAATVDVDESSTTEIEWMIKNTDTGIDGIEADGTQVPPAPGAGTTRTFTATGSNRLYTFTITGTITGPPGCTGSGTWSIVDVDGTTARGSGTWTIP